MPSLNVTIGQKLYDDMSCKVNLYVYNPLTKQEHHISALHARFPEGLTVVKGNPTLSRDGVQMKAGGAWTPYTVTADEDTLFKVVVITSGHLRKKQASAYFFMSEGVGAGTLTCNKVPHKTPSNLQLPDEIITILSGQFEMIDVDTAELKYGMYINPIFKGQSSPFIVDQVLNHTAIVESSIRKQTVVEKKITVGSGESISVKQLSKKSRRRIIT